MANARHDDEAYPRALRALAAIPEQLEADLHAASRDRTEQLVAVQRELDGALRRIAAQRTAAEEGYRRSAEALAAHGVRVPPRVRPATGVPGDADALARVRSAHDEAVASVARAVRDAEHVGERARLLAEREEQSRRVTASRAADALALREAHARQAREEAAAAHAARVQSERARRARIRLALLASGGAAVVVLIVIIIVVVATT